MSKSKTQTADQPVDLDAATKLYGSVVKAAESIEGKDITVYAGGRKEAVDKPFVMLFYEALSELIIDNRLGITDMKIMLAICGLARFGNMVALSQGGLAESLNLDKAAISRSIKKMTKEGVLLKTKLGLFINPTLIVKGGLTKIEPLLWDEALLSGYDSPLKSVTKRQQAKKLDTVIKTDQPELF